ncbi:MAG: hypothetical protein KUG77_20090 [Nannocystaceae bacterium]|nr:hypothetical protein [Nannocystaceae bacterium]
MPLVRSETLVALKKAMIPAMLGFWASACAGMGGPLAQRHEPLSAVAPTDLVDQVVARAGKDCGEALRGQLLSGHDEPGTCSAVESVAARVTILHNGVKFGIVDHRDVELDRVRLRLSEAGLCKGWPLPIDDDAGVVLRGRDADRAGCVVRPYRGSLVLTAVDAEGNRHQADMLDVGKDGEVVFEFAALDASLRRAVGQGLDAYAWLELGETAWAGTINLERMRGFIADWHFVWVARGRGSAALFAERHAEHPHGADAQEMALQARLERQRQDFDAVAEGKMTASAFLERHVWSPFRQAVKELRVTAE